MCNLSGRLIVLALTLTVMFATAQGSLPQSTFQDQFDNLSSWVAFGTPVPEIVPSQFSRTGVLDNAGDGTDKSGAISIQRFTGSGGFTLTADVYLDFNDTALCAAEAAIGIANPTLQAWSGYDAYVSFSIAGVGRSCAILSDSLRAHAYFFGSFETASGTESFFPTEASPLPFRADQYAGGWHALKIIVDGTGRPRFYIDNTLIYTGANAVSGAVLSTMNPLWVGSQSSGNAGKAYHDNISYTNSCVWPEVASLTTPADSATVCATLVTLSWAADGAATEYQIQVDNNSTLLSPEFDLQIPTPTTTVAITIADDCLPRYWRVRAINNCATGAWCTPRVFTVCTTLTPPTLAAPADGATGLTQPISIDWNAVLGATSYSLQVDDSSSFNSPEFDLNTPETVYSVSQLVGSTTYYWRVRADNACDHSTWTATRDFETAPCPLADVAVLQTPADGDSLLTQPVVLNWADAALATAYRVQLDDDTSFATPVYNGESAVSTASISGLPAGAVRYWRIKSYNPCGWSDWSVKRRFSTCAPIAAPGLVEPLEGAVIEQRPVFFDWGTVADADSYMVEIDVVNSFDGAGLVRRVLAGSLSQFGSYDVVANTCYYWRVRAYSDCGWGTFSAARSCSTGTALAVREIEGEVLPTEFTLMQNYPNPFNAETAIEFNLPQASWVRLVVLNILGQEIAVLVDEPLTAGRKMTTWNGLDSSGKPVSSGVYFYRIIAGSQLISKKMVLLK
ncbi:MAG: T9SS type A sorting domain-containing protein [bacterium]|nr:T9SS type A sorting domain-containing protein [bacterium]